MAKCESLFCLNNGQVFELNHLDLESSIGYFGHHPKSPSFTASSHHPPHLLISYSHIPPLSNTTSLQFLATCSPPEIAPISRSLLERNSTDVSNSPKSHLPLSQDISLPINFIQLPTNTPNNSLLLIRHQLASRQRAEHAQSNQSTESPSLRCVHGPFFELT